MNKPLFLAAAASAAFVTLSACDREPQVVNGLPDSQAEALKNAPPVELPPAIMASKQYRCADNSLYIVDFYNNNTAAIRVGSREAARTILSADDGGNPPFTADGYSLSGNGDNVTINGKSCHT